MPDTTPRPFNTLAEYDAAIEVVVLDIAHIRGQLEKANATLHTTGVYADADWYRRARAALRFRGAEHQMLLGERAKLRRDINAASAEAFQHQFIAAARSLLDEATFRQILIEARARHEATMGARHDA